MERKRRENQIEESADEEEVRRVIEEQEEMRRVIREEGMSAILVEQNAKKILGVTDRAIILERGNVVHAADSVTLAADRAALETHLGVTDHGPRRSGRARQTS